MPMVRARRRGASRCASAVVVFGEVSFESQLEHEVGEHGFDHESDAEISSIWRS
jgi:hypothetical protein